MRRRRISKPVLERLKKIPTGEDAAEDLKKDSLAEKSKGGVKSLTHVREVCLSGREWSQADCDHQWPIIRRGSIVDRSSQKARGSYWVAYLRSQGNLPDLLHAQDHDGGRVQTSETTIEKTRSIHKRRGEEGSPQVAWGWTYLPHLWQCLGTSSPSGAQERRNDSSP